MSAATPSGYILFFYAVDVAEAVNLPALDDLLGGTTKATQFVPRSTAPAYLQYEQSAIAGGQMLELTIALILVLELALVFLGVLA